MKHLALLFVMGVQSPVQMRLMSIHGGSIAEYPRNPTGSIVGYDIFHSHVQALIVVDNCREEGGFATSGLIGCHSGGADAGKVVNGGIQIFLSCSEVRAIPVCHLITHCLSYARHLVGVTRWHS